MAEEFQYQLSVSLPPSEQYAKGDMVNIRANNAHEFMQNLVAFDDHMAEVAASTVASIRAKWTVIRDAGGSVVEYDRQAPPQNPQNPPQSAQQQPQAAQYQGPPQGAQNGAQQFQGQQYPPQQQGYQGQPQGYQQPNQQQAQQQPANDGIPTSPPPNVGPPPSCSHGVKNYLAKPYKNGKPGYWQAWACPADKNDPTQHELEFIRNR